MNELKWFAWMFPLLFIIHDMEEIIMAKLWCKKGLKQYIPLHMTPFGGAKSTAAVAIGVYEELILWVLVTLLGNISGFYGLWYGLLVANIVHLVLLHIILLPLSYRKYVPGQITAWITVLPCCYILKLAEDTLKYSYSEITIWVVISLLVTVINLKVLHKNVSNFAKLME